MEFHEITLNDREWMTEKFNQDNKNGCESIFSNNFLWSGSYGITVGECLKSLVVRYKHMDRYVFSYPVGGSKKDKVIEELRNYCHEMGQPLCLTGLYEGDTDKVMKAFPGQFLIREMREDADYIYTWKKLAYLAGKKLHGKRNHIARFMDDKDWSYEKITEGNIGECREMSLEWKESLKDKWNEEMEDELNVLFKAFKHYAQLNLKGGLIRKQGKIAAFSIGEPLNEDTFVVHFEKAFSFIQGAYPMINQQFVLNECRGYKYINREEDAGDPGLRRAKLSYCPDILLRKYHAVEGCIDGCSSAVSSSVGFSMSESSMPECRNAESSISKCKNAGSIMPMCCNSNINIATLHPQINRQEVINLWETSFGDSKEVISYYMEHRMTRENMLGIFEDKKLVSMASFLPAAYHLKGNSIPVRYVYAVATLPEYRGRGYAAELIKQGNRLWGEALILSPADEKLYSYYEKLGFLIKFKEKIEKFEINETGLDDNIQTYKISSSKEKNKEQCKEQCKEEKAADYILKDITPKEYKKIRDKAFMGEGYVEWSGEAVSFAVSFHRFMNGEVKKIDDDIIFYDVREGEIYVSETTLKGEKKKKVLSALCEKYGVRQAVHVIPGGMLLPAGAEGGFYEREDKCRENSGYLNLILD